MNAARSSLGDGPATAGLKWQVSSYCGGNGECVAIAKLPDGDVAVKDTKEHDGLMLRFSQREWRAFIAGVRAGEFDS